jgi:hypothetical protein
VVVEERLRSSAHRHDRVVCHRVEVGTDVAGDLCPAMDAADPAGGEHRHAGMGCKRDGRRHGRRAERPVLSYRHGEVAFRSLAGRSEDSVVLARIDPDPCDAVEHGCDGRHGPARANRSETAFERFGVGG